MIFVFRINSTKYSDKLELCWEWRFHLHRGRLGELLQSAIHQHSKRSLFYYYSLTYSSQPTSGNRTSERRIWLSISVQLFRFVASANIHERAIAWAVGGFRLRQWRGRKCCRLRGQNWSISDCIYLCMQHPKRISSTCSATGTRRRVTWTNLSDGVPNQKLWPQGCWSRPGNNIQCGGKANKNGV